MICPSRALKSPQMIVDVILVRSMGSRSRMLEISVCDKDGGR